MAHFLGNRVGLTNRWQGPHFEGSMVVEFCWALNMFRAQQEKHSRGKLWSENERKVTARKVMARKEGGEIKFATYRALLYAIWHCLDLRPARASSIFAFHLRWVANLKCLFLNTGFRKKTNNKTNTNQKKHIVFKTNYFIIWLFHYFIMLPIFNYFIVSFYYFSFRYLLI